MSSGRLTNNGNICPEMQQENMCFPSQTVEATGGNFYFSSLSYLQDRAMNGEYEYLQSSVQLNTRELIICKKISGELLCPCLITSHRTN